MVCHIHEVLKPHKCIYLIRSIRPPRGDTLLGKSVGLESYILTRKVSYLTWDVIVGVTKHLNYLPLVGYLTG